MITLTIRVRPNPTDFELQQAIAQAIADCSQPGFESYALAQLLRMAAAGAPYPRVRLAEPPPPTTIEKGGFPRFADTHEYGNPANRPRTVEQILRASPPPEDRPYFKPNSSVPAWVFWLGVAGLIGCLALAFWNAGR